VHDNIWVRVPLIPGFNNEPEMLAEMARFVASIPAVRQVNLLPYHEMGTHKSPGCGEPGARAESLEVTSEELDDAAAVFRAVGLTTHCGG
jgi:pyruvate formate lyase activating enzyme